MSKKKYRKPSGGTATAARTGSSSGAQARQREREVARSSSAQRQRRGAQKKNTTPLWVGGLIVAAVAVVVFFVYLASNQQAAGKIGPSDPKILQAVTNVKSNVISEVKTGNLSNYFQSTGSTDTWKSKDGKPVIFYYGAEFCPICAGTRWSEIIALSRFGKFDSLPLMLSSAKDTPASVSTFSFVGSKYTSDYIDFQPVEAQDRDGGAKEQPNDEQSAILQQYKVTGFPFIDIAGKYVAATGAFDSSILNNLSQQDIANKLSKANDNVTRNIVGAANYMTAAICSAIDDKAADVCGKDPISSIEYSIKNAKSFQPSTSGNSIAAVNTPVLWKRDEF